jgi:hypothetical protein
MVTGLPGLTHTQFQLPLIGRAMVAVLDINHLEAIAVCETLREEGLF